MTDKIGTPQPYYLPGYTGFVPQWKHQCGLGLGSHSHQILMDPNSCLANYSVLSKTKPPFKIKALNFCTEVDHDKYLPGISIVNLKCTRFFYSFDSQIVVVFNFAIGVGYTGFVPRQKYFLGLVEDQARCRALKDFDKRQELITSAWREVQTVIDSQTEACVKGLSLSGRQIRGTETTMPLTEVNHLLAIPPKNETELNPNFYVSPYFLPCTHEEKYVKQGATIFVPRKKFTFGKVHKCSTKEALCEFIENYNKLKEHRKYVPLCPCAKKQSKE